MYRGTIVLFWHILCLAVTVDRIWKPNGVEEDMTLGLFRRNALGLAVTGGLFLAASIYPAAAEETSLLDYRQNVMTSLEGHVKAAGLIVNEKVPFSHHLADHAVAIVGTSRGLLEVFADKAKKAEAGEKKDKNDADSPPFPVLAAQFNLEAARLVQITPTGDKGAIQAQYATMTKVYDALVKATGDDANDGEAKKD
jgi:cytochrome c556